MSEPLKPFWWPENPYSQDIFALDDRNVYVQAVTDENLRTAISGMLGRRFWQIASDSIWSAMQENPVPTDRLLPILVELRDWISWAWQYIEIKHGPRWQEGRELVVRADEAIKKEEGK